MDLTILCLLVFAATLLGTKIVLKRAQKEALFDYPGERSSHKVPTPHGGGLALSVVVIGAWLFLGLKADDISIELIVVLTAMAGLAIISRLDDITPLPAKLRLAAQALAVGATLATLPVEGGIIGLIPAPIEWALVAIGWIWFINLYNFMDGIDGITGVETLTIGGGIALLTLGGSAASGFGGGFALVIAAAVLGFLWWNWHPAKIFMGDVGSVPLGFALGWLLLHLALSGHWAAALILPLYYLADATLTLGRRLLRGDKVWEAHKEHFYQQAYQAGWPHDKVVLTIATANMVLVALAWTASQGWPWESLGAAVLTVALLLVRLSKMGRRP